MIPSKYIIPSFLPEFMKEDYPLFREFLEAYFEFTEREGIDLQSLRDPWNTTEQFLDLLLKDILPEVSSIPLDAQGKRILASRIIELRKAKGSYASYELFFKLFYGTSVDIETPYEDVLIPSASKWVQNYSMLVRSIFSVDPIEELRGKAAYVSNGSTQVKINVSNAALVEGDIYEVFFDRSFVGAINVGDNLLSQTFTSRFEILSSLSTLKIKERGIGFRGGIFVSLPNDNGNPATFKITKSGTGGSVLSIAFRDQGFGFNGEGFDIFFAPPPNTSIISVPAFYTRQEAIDWYRSFLPGSSEGSLYEGYELHDAVELYRSGLSDASISTLIGSVRIESGAFCKRAGFYEDNKNILSDVAILQGGALYQKYSYVTKVQKRLEEYKTLLKTMIHPAGFALFGSFDVYQKGSIKLSWKNFIQRTYIRVFEDFVGTSSIIIKAFGKRSNVQADIATSISKGASKPLQSQSSVSAIKGNSPNKTRSNTTNASDTNSLAAIKGVSNNAFSQTSIIKQTGKGRNNTSSVSANASVNPNKATAKTVNTTAVVDLRLLGLYVDLDYIQGGSYLYASGLEKTAGILDPNGNLYDDSELFSWGELFT